MGFDVGPERVNADPGWLRNRRWSSPTLLGLPGFEPGTSWPPATLDRSTLSGLVSDCLPDLERLAFGVLTGAAPYQRVPPVS
jgi:hypothetical protein